MKPNLSSSSALLATLLLTACSGTLLESKKIDYKSAGRLPSLEVPPDLTAPTIDERYVIPENGKGATTFSAYREGRSPAAANSEVLPQSDKMRIERDGNQRWLVVTGTPEEIWPKIREFWQVVGFNLTVDLPAAGVMETDWNENRAKLPQDIIRNTLGKALDFMYSTPERDKYRTRLEKGSTPGTTEIYISHRGMVELFVTEGKDDTRWQPRPPDPELEAEMLQRLMVRMGADVDRAKTLLATPGKTTERAKLAATGDLLNVNEPFDRAWRRVGLALDRIGFTVEDRDRNKGVYFVRYVDPEIDPAKAGNNKGFLSKLMFWKNEKVDETKSTQMRITIKADGANSSVQVQGRDGVADKSDTAQKILKLLFDQLK